MIPITPETSPPIGLADGAGVPGVATGVGGPGARVTMRNAAGLGGSVSRAYGGAPSR
jgi:hypothetical protein